MIQSMTGFGSGTNENFTVEIRSLNHRFIEIFVKMPSYMLHHEISLRNLIKSKFERGRFDVVISFKNERLLQLRINKEQVRNIYLTLKKIQDELSIPGEVSIDTITGYKDYILDEMQEYDEGSLYDAFQKAISSLEAMRIKEGSVLIKDVLRGVEKIADINNQIRKLAPFDYDKKKNRFRERVRSLVSDESLDENRIYQEIVILGEKLDISEEISRIESHICQFKDIINNEDIVGKKLDFLLQEINREVNTIACKSSDHDISRLVVEMKSELEKMREQIQNIQ